MAVWTDWWWVQRVFHVGPTEWLPLTTNVLATTDKKSLVYWCVYSYYTFGDQWDYRLSGPLSALSLRLDFLHSPFHKLHFKIIHLSFTMMQCSKVQDLWVASKWEICNIVCCASFQFIVSWFQIQLCHTESERCQHFFANWLNVMHYQ